MWILNFLWCLISRGIILLRWERLGLYDNQCCSLLRQVWIHVEQGKDCDLLWIFIKTLLADGRAKWRKQCCTITLPYVRLVYLSHVEKVILEIPGKTKRDRLCDIFSLLKSIKCLILSITGQGLLWNNLIALKSLWCKGLTCLYWVCNDIANESATHLDPAQTHCFSFPVTATVARITPERWKILSIAAEFLVDKEARMH